MTAPTEPVSPFDRANYLAESITLALSPGGPLYRDLSDLISEVEGELFRAAGVDGEDPSRTLTIDHDAIVEEIRYRIHEQMFKAAAVYTGLRPADR